LAPGVWNEALIHGNVKSVDELHLIEKHGIKLIAFATILQDLSRGNERKHTVFNV